MTVYREKLYPAVWLIAALGLFLPASVLVFLPLNPLVGVLVGLVLWWGCTAILWVFAPALAVETKGIRAGRAQIDHRFIQEMEAFSKENATLQRGPDLDARAWLVLRPWVSPVVKITIGDPEDPTPYWLVSSRNPEKFIAAWRSARDSI